MFLCNRTWLPARLNGACVPQADISSAVMPTGLVEALSRPIADLTLDSESAVLSIFFANSTHFCVFGIVSPGKQCIHAWIHVNDDAFRCFTIDSHHLRAACGCPRSCDQVPTMRRDDRSGFRKIFLRVAIGIADVDLADQVRRRSALCMEGLARKRAESGATQHDQTDFAS